MQALRTEYAPKLSKHFDGIYLNDTLWQRVKTVFAQKEKAGLKPEQLKLLAEYFSKQ